MVERGEENSAIFVDLRVPGSQFELGNVFVHSQDVEIELERIIPVEAGLVPLLWVSGGSPDELVRAIGESPSAHDVKILTRTGGKSLFRVKWNPDLNGLVTELVRNEGIVYRGTGTPNTWNFKVQFPDRSHLQSFYRGCRRHGIDIDITRIHHSSDSSGREFLTEEQLESLRIAYERGFWDIPRGTTLSELAGTLGISDSAASERLRRGIRTLIDESGLVDQPP